MNLVIDIHKLIVRLPYQYVKHQVLHSGIPHINIRFRLMIMSIHKIILRYKNIAQNLNHMKYI